MIDTGSVINAWRDFFLEVNDGVFDFAITKPEVDAWIEANVYLPESTTVHPGFYDFNFTPYMREIVNHLHPRDPVRFISIMKDGQSGFTTALVIGGMMYIIENIPDGILFTAADINLSKKTIEERFDPIMRSSKKQHLIRPNVVKRTNNRTGDTSTKKEYANGTMTIAGTNSANTFRMFSAKFAFNDDYDTAPKEIGKEGSPKAVMKTRQNSYGDKAKTIMISTPTVTQTSNIYEQYLLGTQKKWNWPCPACETFFAVEWEYRNDEGRFGGVIWELDDNRKLKLESVRYMCPHCGHQIEEKEKYDLNLLGKWVATCPIPAERRHESYQKNSIYNPPGFDGWITFVEEWLAACPPGEKVNVLLLKTFNNLRLGLPFAELGESPRVNELMQNTRDYLPGYVPDVTCNAQGNGQIVMLTLAADINGFMEKDNEDVRLDWEVLAHTATGATYSVDHGSIGTHKRTRDRTAQEKNIEAERERWTLTHNVKRSVWPEFEAVMRKEWPLQSSMGERPTTDLSRPTTMNVLVTAIDTGFGEKSAMLFVQKMRADDFMCFGVKGDVYADGRRFTKDTIPVKRSTERPRELYIVEVDQIKDDLSHFMQLREGDDGSQPAGFMNFPQARDMKYDMKSFFSHYESERRMEIKKAGQVVGYKWDKKNNQVQNHFWDVRVYNLAAPYIFIDYLKQWKPSQYKNFTWEEYVMIMCG